MTTYCPTTTKSWRATSGVRLSLSFLLLTSCLLQAASSFDASTISTLQKYQLSTQHHNEQLQNNNVDKEQQAEDPCELDCGPGQCRLVYAKVNNIDGEDEHNNNSDNITQSTQSQQKNQNQEVMVAHAYCHCPQGWTGDACSEAETEIVAAGQSNHCDLDCGEGQCRIAYAQVVQPYFNRNGSNNNNNGSGNPSGVSVFQHSYCSCPPEYTGKYCRDSTVVQAISASSSSSANTAATGSSNNLGASSHDGNDCDGVVCYNDMQHKKREELSATMQKPRPKPCRLNCQNGGVCVPGSSGNNDIDNSKTNNISRNPRSGSLQFFTVDQFEHCQCPRGWTGPTCETQIEVCGEDGHVCLHGSKCLSQNDGTFRCDCEAAWTSTLRVAGEFCQHHHTDVCNHHKELSYFSGSPRDHAFCVNDGVCRDQDNMKTGGHPGCDCPSGWTGAHCEFPNLYENAAALQAQEEVFVSHIGLLIYLFFVAIFALIFGFVLWHVHKKSEKFSADAENPQREDNIQSTKSSWGSPSKEDPDGVAPLEVVEIL